MTTTLVTYTIYSVISCLYCYKKRYAILIIQENSIKTVSTEKAASVKIGGLFRGVEEVIVFRDNAQGNYSIMQKVK